MKLSMIFLLCLLLFHEGLAAKSLYDSNDAVFEVTAENESLIASPDKIWVVEFYAHWCGHCIRYSPFWKRVAKLFEPWKDSVAIAAFNCAEFDCSTYEIPGTPTIKVFTPFNNVPSGVEIQSHKRLVLHDIFDAIKEVRSKEEEDPSKYPDLSPFSGTSLDDIQSDTDKTVLLFKELPELDWSERVVLQFAYDSNYDFKIIDSRKRTLSQELGITSRPAVAIVNWGDRSKDEIFHVDLSSYTSTLDQVSDFLKNKLLSMDSGVSEANSIETADVALTSANHSDIVYEGDLEKVVKYMLTIEIPMYSTISEGRLFALRYFLETLSRYLPLRSEIIVTIVELKRWIDELSFFGNDEYEQKIDQLIEKYDPFKHTPAEWKGCKGSTPYFRGYPCGVWTLFHVLSVNAAARGDPMLMSESGTSRVVVAMFEYIKYFFSCRHCAKNFMEKVDTIGSFPSNSTDVILWVWKIHNMANQKLMGDSTEDPDYPKIIWPSPSNCPKCRSPEGEFEALGEVWNTYNLLSYIVKVYREDSIHKISMIPPPDLEEEKLVADILSGKLKDKETVIRRLRSYCSKLRK